LLIYHFGVAQYLQDTFDLSRTRISGTSGGAIAAALLAADVPMSKAFSVFKEMADLSKSSCTGPLFTGLPRLLKKLRKLLPSDEVVAARCSRRLHLALTAFPFMETRIMQLFPTKEILATAIISSMNLPVFMCPVPSIDGVFYIDGALTCSEPSCSSETITVSPCSVADVSPQPLPGKLHFFVPGSDEFQKEMFEQGIADAKARHQLWLERGFVLRNSTADPLDRMINEIDKDGDSTIDVDGQVKSESVDNILGMANQLSMIEHRK
jgi:hypothetical protein